MALPKSPEPEMGITCPHCGWSGTNKSLNEVEGYSCPKCGEPLFPPEWLSEGKSVVSGSGPNQFNDVGRCRFVGLKDGSYDMEDLASMLVAGQCLLQEGHDGPHRPASKTT